MRWGNKWPKYVPVAKKRQRSAREVELLRSNGIELQPVVIEGRRIVRTFWAQKWCEHLESFSDYANRMPRGRTYVRNGCVLHLQVTKGQIKAMVSGTTIYHVKISVDQFSDVKWNAVKEQCTGKIGSLLELLQGKFSTEVMSVVTHKHNGLFPLPAEIKLNCTCPDWASMCKHVAAVLYGFGNRLDEQPETLFLLRGVEHKELISVDAALFGERADTGTGARGRRRVAESDIANVFGIEIDPPEIPLPGNTAADTSAPETLAPETVPPDAPFKVRPTTRFTGRAVRALRKKMLMDVGAFAEYLGVSAVTVCKWECTKGALNLQTRSVEALQRASREV